ncbi:hypothetical protein BJF90_09380 [Pseudonocardia sp. CNS-004]|nr:hypothetical protein BJF90_09380 [Pseudonocardia sp. CNS-004]
MKLALMFAGMAAGRRAGGPGELLKGGSKLLSASPELARLTDEVRGRLMEAGKTAALAVATRQVESITDRVGRRVESLGDLGTPQRRTPEEPPPEQDAEDEYVEEPAADDEPREDEPADEGPADEGPAEDSAPARRRPARARATQASGGRAGAATTSARRTTSGTAGPAGKGTGKSGNGRRSPRTRKAESDG